jgi:ABC-type proline/glycine betaine transport system ATPase subunit
MLARLGFAAAIHMDPEIILLDEVLSVGDYIFGIKARSAILKFIGEGTLVFVSHDLDSVEKLCERVIWMDNGGIRAIGNSSEVIASYMQNQQNQINNHRKQQKPPAKSDSGAAGVSKPVTTSGVQTRSINAHDDDSDTVKVHKRLIDSRVQISSVSVHDKDGAERTQFEFGEEIVLRCRIQLSEPIPDLRVIMGITDINTRAVITICDNQQVEPLGMSAGELLVEAHFPATQLRPLGLGAFIGVSNPVALLELTSWQDLGPRFFTIGSRRDPEHHYYAPQRDLIYTPGVYMKRLDSSS